MRRQDRFSWSVSSRTLGIRGRANALIFFDHTTPSTRLPQPGPLPGDRLSYKARDFSALQRLGSPSPMRYRSPPRISLRRHGQVVRRGSAKRNALDIDQVASSAATLVLTIQEKISRPIALAGSRPFPWSRMDTDGRNWTFKGSQKSHS